MNMNMNKSTEPDRHSRRFRAVVIPSAAALMAAGLLAGCAVPVHQQRLVSRPSMQFSDTAASGYHSKVLSQIETGAAATGGAQAAGCTSCR